MAQSEKRQDNCVYSYLKKAAAKMKELDQFFLFIGKGFSKIINFEDLFYLFWGSSGCCLYTIK